MAIHSREIQTVERKTEYRLVSVSTGRGETVSHLSQISLNSASVYLNERLRTKDRRKYNLPESVLVANSLDEALQLSDNRRPQVDNIFVIGGKMPFEEGIQHPACRRIYYTRIFTKFDCDTFLPPIDATEFQIIEESVSEWPR